MISGKYFLLSVLSLSLLTTVNAQVEFSEPEKLPVTINSPAEEDFPIVSQDGKTLIFNRTFCPDNVGGLFAGQDIWISQKGDTTWLPAQNTFPSESVESLNDEYNNVVIGLSTNSDTLYLLNKYHHHKRRSKHHNHHSATHSGISYSILRDSVWSAPYDFEVPHIGEEQFHYTAYMNPTADVLILAMFGGMSLGEEDLFYCLKTNGSWSEPKHLGDRINTSSFEMSPFLDKDLKTLYFSSDRPGGKGGADIYMTQRLDDTWENWTQPVNLGEPINTHGFEAYMYLTEDKAYFTRNPDTLTSDLFVADITRGGDKIETSLDSKELAVFPADSLIDLEPLVNLEMHEKLKKLVNEEEYMREGIDKDSLIYQGALVYKDEYNKQKGFQVVDLHNQEVLDKSKEELKEMKLSPQAVDIHFNYNLSSLDTDDEKVLERVVYLLKNDPELKAVVVGHTCDVGSHEFNDKLSKQRAYAASAYLVAQGITHDRMLIKWQGELKPITTNDTEEGKAINRRVEIDFKRNQ